MVFLGLHLFGELQQLVLDFQFCIYIHQIIQLKLWNQCICYSILRVNEIDPNRELSPLGNAITSGRLLYH